MRHIFIDLGAFSGDTIKSFLNWSHLKFNPSDFEIYGFEPNPIFEKPLLELQAQNPRIKIETAAAWTQDIEAEFAVDRSSDPQGSTLMHSKAQWSTGIKIQVRCFDFSKWLEQFFGCYVIVKMDIEGAEFPILEKLLADGNLAIINWLMVEFHANKVPEYTTTYKNELLERLRKITQVTEWH